MEFKDKLRSLRKQRGLSQQALADAIFVSRSTVAKWENGLGLPGKESTEALLSYFQITEDALKTQEPEQVILVKNRRIRTMRLQWIALLVVILLAAAWILPNTNTGMKLGVYVFRSALEQSAQQHLQDADSAHFLGFRIRAYPAAGAVFFENTTWGYRGLFYSKNGKPVGFQGVDMEFYRCGRADYYWSEGTGDNWMHVQHIVGNWYWYEMHL